MPNNTKKSLIFVMDRWQSTAGGIQTVNRELACSIAAMAPSIECIALVKTATDVEYTHSSQNGVKLIAGQDENDWSSVLLSRALEEIAAESVVAVIGHSYFSGAQAFTLRERFFRKALFVHFVHMNSFDTESLKDYRKTSYIMEREKKFKEELKSAEQANIVACIGPRLWTYMRDQLAARKSKAHVIRIDCGVKRAQDERTPPIQPTLLCMGRTDSIEVKGLDIFAYAAGELTQNWRNHPSTNGRPLPKFIVRGSKDGGEELQNNLRGLSKTAGVEANIQVRPYTTQAQELDADLLGSSVFVMPSREEGFGLVACEALSLGVPVLVSSNSGFADVLREMSTRTFISLDRCVVRHVEDPRETAHRYAQAALELLIGSNSAETYAHQIREHMYSRCSWDFGAKHLLDTIKQMSGLDIVLREPEHTQESVASQATEVLRRHRSDLISIQGVSSVLVKHAIVVFVESGFKTRLPKELDGVDVVVREVGAVKLTSIPVIRSGNSVMLNGMDVSCVGALVNDEHGTVFAITVAHALPLEIGHELEVSIRVTSGQLLEANVFLIDQAADLALLKVPHSRPPTSIIPVVGPALGMQVQILTGQIIATGLVSGIDVSARVHSGMSTPVDDMFSILLDADTVESGHSGALVIESKSGRPLGIVVAMLERPAAKKRTVFAKTLAPFLDKHRLSVISYSHGTPSTSKADIRIGIIVSSQETLDLLLQSMIGPRRATHGSIAYFYGRLSENGPLLYVHKLSRMGNLGSAVATANMIHGVDPDCLMVVGIAGGLRPGVQALGDVVVSSEIAYYEPAKIIGNQVEPRFRVVKITPHWLLSMVEDLSNQSFHKIAWRALPDGTANTPKIHIGAVASGEKLIYRSSHLDEMLGGWRKVLAVEMEGAGVAEAGAFSEKDVPVIVVRGLADFPQEELKASQGHAEIAATNAVQVALELARVFQEREQQRKSFLR